MKLYLEELNDLRETKNNLQNEKQTIKNTIMRT